MDAVHRHFESTGQDVAKIDTFSRRVVQTDLVEHRLAFAALGGLNGIGEVRRNDDGCLNGGLGGEGRTGGVKQFDGVGAALQPFARFIFHRPGHRVEFKLLASEEVQALFPLGACGRTVHKHRAVGVVDVQDHGARRIHRKRYGRAVVDQLRFENERLAGLKPRLVWSVQDVGRQSHLAFLSRNHADEQRGHQQPRHHQPSACRLLAHVET